MAAERLRGYLDDNGVKYVTIRHSPAVTAQEIAEAAHVSGKQLAKTVIVDIDGSLAMAVVAAPDVVDLDRAARIAGGGEARLAHEEEFAGRFGDCEIGAMPPFGNLYEMSVFVDERLAREEEIAFNAGSFRELFRMRYPDFERLVRPRVAPLVVEG